MDDISTSLSLVVTLRTSYPTRRPFLSCCPLLLLPTPTFGQEEMSCFSHESQGLCEKISFCPEPFQLFQLTILRPHLLSRPCPPGNSTGPFFFPRICPPALVPVKWRKAALWPQVSPVTLPPAWVKERKDKQAQTNSASLLNLPSVPVPDPVNSSLVYPIAQTRTGILPHPQHPSSHQLCHFTSGTRLGWAHFSPPGSPLGSF